MPGVEQRDGPADSDDPDKTGPGGAPGPGPNEPLKVRISADDLERSRIAAGKWRAEQARAAEKEDGDELTDRTNSSSSDLPISENIDAVQVIAIFGGVAGLASLSVIPASIALPAVMVAFATLAYKASGGVRVAACVLTAVAFGCSVVAWAGSITSHHATGLDSELSKANMRLEIVDEVNRLRQQHHVRPLNYDAALSLVAQQRADFAAADHSGFATAQTAGQLPSEETNMWAEMAGVACSWTHLFELEKPNQPLPAEAEIGFMEGGADVGQHLPRRT